MASTSQIEWVEIGEASKALNICRRSIKEKINQGLFTLSADGNKKYLKVAEINKYLEERVIIKRTH